MAQKHQRSNREAKKPKQNKPKVVVSASLSRPPQSAERCRRQAQIARAASFDVGVAI